MKVLLHFLLVLKIKLIFTNKFAKTSFFSSGKKTAQARKRVNAAGKTVNDYTLAFEISQKNDSLYVLSLIVNTFGWGKVYTEKRGISKFRLVPKDLILNDLVPFFDKYPLEGNKALQYSI